MKQHTPGESVFRDPEGDKLEGYDLDTEPSYPPRGLAIAIWLSVLFWALAIGGLVWWWQA
jgi:hypothetical protein